MLFCQKWDSNPRPHTRTRILMPLLSAGKVNLESGALDRSAILTYVLYFPFKRQQYINYDSHLITYGITLSYIYLHSACVAVWKCHTLNFCTVFPRFIYLKVLRQILRWVGIHKIHNIVILIIETSDRNAQKELSLI